MDEGGTKLTIRFIDSLKEKTLVFNRGHADIPLDFHRVLCSPSIDGIMGFILFAVYGIAHIVRFRPGFVYFFPLARPSIWYQLIALLMNLISRDFAEVLYQHSRIGTLFKTISRFKVFAISKAYVELLQRSGINAEQLTYSCKKPELRYDKNGLRRKYGYSKDDFIVTHVGHRQNNRGIQILSELAKEPWLKVVLVLSSSPGDEETSIHERISLIDRYVDDIYEVYALSDVYIFPIIDESASIDVPLSIMEARQMNLPIVASDAGYIGEALEDYDKGHLIQPGSPEDMARRITDVLVELRKKWETIDAEQSMPFMTI